MTKIDGGAEADVSDGDRLGFQKVDAVCLSATMTTVDPKETVDTPDGEPVSRTVPLTSFAAIADPVTTGAKLLEELKTASML